MKKFLIIGNVNAITYKEIFPFIKYNKVWLGVHNRMDFMSHDKNSISSLNVRWFTNLLHKKHNTPITLTHTYTPEKYLKYDNYNAINVNKVCEIPNDYDGVMGVPITFLDKYCLEQFEIIGIFVDYKKSDIDYGIISGIATEYIHKNGKTITWNGPTINKKAMFARILIKLKNKYEES